MAARPTASKKPKKTSKKTVAKSKSKIVASGPRSFFGQRPLLLISALLFGAVGIYLLAQSGALSPDEKLLADDPGRGLLYEGKKVKTKGPCKGGFDITTAADEKQGKDKRRCVHLDPTPPGVDIRERIKHVDQDLANLAAKDEKVKPMKSGVSSGTGQSSEEMAAAITAGSMNDIGAMDWPCIGTGKDGARVQFVYAYSPAVGNRLSDLRPGINAIARRMNSLYWQSGHESGNGHQIRFATGIATDCWLAIAPVAVPYSSLDDLSAVRAKVREAGLVGIAKKVDLNGDGVADTTTYSDRKYIIMIDRDAASKCGQGEIRSDDSPGQDNVNNNSVTYAYIWKGCWNYAEPHELMHMLGGVQHSAPRATAGWHCYDERDVMCYDDDGAGGVVMHSVCTRAIDYWRLDCNHNDYYRGNSPSTGYLSNHWNTANSRFLTR